MTDTKHFLTFRAPNDHARRLLGDRDELTLEIYRANINPSWSTATTPAPEEKVPGPLIALGNDEEKYATKIEWETDDFFSRRRPAGFTVDYYVRQRRWPHDWVGRDESE